MTSVTSQLTVTFQPPAAAPGESGPGQPRLLLTYHPCVSTTASSVIPLRLYPPVPATLFATQGTVTRANPSSGVEVVTAEVVTFAGNDKAQPHYPGGQNFSWQSLGATFAADGTPCDPQFHYDATTDEVVADQACYGGVTLSYQAPYQIYDYTAAGDPVLSGSTTGIFLRYGTVIAVYQGSTAQLDIAAPTNRADQSKAELYRVTSQIVLDPKGAWECPPQWPTSSEHPYPDLPGASGPDADNSFTDERPHEIALIDTLGELWVYTYWVSWLQPYVGSETYHPKYQLRKATIPATLKQVAQTVGWTDLNAQLRWRYPGIAL